MTWCEKSRQLQDSLKLIQAELSRETLNYFLEPMDLFSVPGAMGSRFRWITSKCSWMAAVGMDHSNGGQYIFCSDLPLAFIIKCMSTNSFEKSQLDLETSTFYIWKETLSHLLLPPMEKKLPFFVISDRWSAFTYNGSLGFISSQSSLFFYWDEVWETSQNLADFNIFLNLVQWMELSRPNLPCIGLSTIALDKPRVYLAFLLGNSEPKSLSLDLRICIL